ncbi:MAG: NAD(P)/FAD-dependent oxidoreductase [Alsobacter sp.]
MSDPDSQAPAGTRVAIIGAGFGGIAAAVALQKAGIRDVVIFEKSSGVGGTWWDNRYPGAATDAASHIYSFSFAPRDWARSHVGHAELRGYLDSVVDEFGLRPKLRVATGVKDLAWDEARKLWRLTTESGESEAFTAVVSAVGMFGKPNWPKWPGLESFAGPVLHTARWDESVDLRSKRVAVVGTGSSAAQVVPALADQVKQLTLFQRQPGWLLPKSDRDFSERERALLRNPLLRRLYRLKLYLAQELREWNGAFFRPENRQNQKARQAALAYLDTVFADRPDLKAVLTPDYPFMGKRLLISSDFYPALRKPNVRLVPRAVASCTPSGLVDVDGEHHEADAIALCTGFEVTDYLFSLRVTGRTGKTLSQTWNGVAEAFLGMMVPGFPNFFMIYGPGTNGGFIVTNLEWQARFAALEIARIAGGKAGSVEVTQEASDAYNRWLQGRIAGTAFIAGKNYFKTASGQIVTQWPDNATQYALKMALTRRFARWRR